MFRNGFTSTAWNTKEQEKSMIQTEAPKTEESLGERGDFRWISTSLLHVDKKYQRTENYDRAKSLSLKLNWSSFGVLLVVRRKGAYYIYDGQHRALAATIKGVDKLPCLVFKDMALAGEAKNFALVNSFRTNVHPADLFRARVVAEDELTLKTQQTLAKYGYAVTRRKDNVHIRVGAASTVVELQRRGTLNDALHVLTACWPKERRLLGKAQVLWGMHHFVRLYRDADENHRLRLSDTLEKFKNRALPRLLDEAKTLIRVGDQRSAAKALTAVLVATYNKGTATRKKLEFWVE